MSLRIIAPGMLSTIQDHGRFGYQASGFSPSGVADTQAGDAANLLAGNPAGEAVVEMTMQGITAVFEAPCVFALTGADMGATLNDKPIENWQAFCAKAGDTLTMGYAKSGLRAYLAVHGGFDIPIVMGSRSTSLKFGVGGLNGRALKAEDLLAFRVKKEKLAWMKMRRLKAPEYAKEVTLRAVAGPQDDRFPAQTLTAFFHSAYTVTTQLDRMGIRLDGPVLPANDGYDIVTDGIVSGCVQVTANGLPIILMADRQTTGGYTKIAAVISADLPLAAQLTPGCTVRFQQITVEDAQKLARERAREWKRQYYMVNGRGPKAG